MRISLTLLLGLAGLGAAPLRADDPACLLIHATVPAGAYLGTAAPSGAQGGVLDRCTNFTAPEPWGLTGSDGQPYESVWYSEPQNGLGFWIGQDADIDLTFWLAGQPVFDQRVELTTLDGWWSWAGAWDRLDVHGVYVLMIYSLGGDMLESESDDFGGSGGLEPFAEVARAGDNTQATVPEPATLTLFGSALVGLAGAVKRRRYMVEHDDG